jgi:hypothetical protein
MPNWEVYQVAFDKPGGQRVTVLWNGNGDQVRTRVRKNGSSATVLDRNGNANPARGAEGWWVIDLPGATAHYPDDPAGYHFIGGDPMFLVENGVDPATPVVAPALGEPGSVPREFKLFPSPSDLSVSLGQSADFYVSVRGYEGFSDPVSFRVTQWSSQRVPEVQDPSTLPLAVKLPDTMQPGLVGVVHVETAGAEPGIYYFTVEGSGGGQTKSFELALAVG